jgi:hypothetical protein
MPAGAWKPSSATCERAWRAPSSLAGSWPATSARSLSLGWHRCRLFERLLGGLDLGDRRFLGDRPLDHRRAVRLDVTRGLPASAAPLGPWLGVCVGGNVFGRLFDRLGGRFGFNRDRLLARGRHVAALATPAAAAATTATPAPARALALVFALAMSGCAGWQVLGLVVGTDQRRLDLFFLFLFVRVGVVVDGGGRSFDPLRRDRPWA